MLKELSWCKLQSWFARTKYLLICISIMIFLIIIPYTFTQFAFGRLVLGFWLAFILITISFSVYRIRIGGKMCLLFICANLFSIALNIILGTDTTELINRILTSLTLASVTIIIFADLATNKVEEHFTSDYIWGGIATYLLIGLTWGSFYHLVELVTPGSFVVVTPEGTLGFPVFIYFSYYVLTSVGGVLTPITLQAQSIVMIEPIVGVLYIAILIARLINLYFERRTAKAKVAEEAADYYL